MRFLEDNITYRKLKRGVQFGSNYSDRYYNPVDKKSTRYANYSYYI